MAEGDEEKIGRAAGGISEEEERLLHALHLLGIKPQLGSVEDVTRLVQVFGGVEKEPQRHDKPVTTFRDCQFSSVKKIKEMSTGLHFDTK